MNLSAILLTGIVFISTSGPLFASQKGLTRNIISTFYPPTVEQQQVIAQKLVLTDQQRQEMSTVNQRFRSQSKVLKQRYGEAYRSVVKLMNAETPNKQRVNEVLKAFHRTHSQMLDAEVQYWLDLKTLLTPAQNYQLWKLFEESRIRRVNYSSEPR